MAKELANLTLHVDSEALHEIIRQGRLMEFAATVATQAAAQISAQLVNHVATAGLSADGLKAGASVGVSYVFDGGDFGTHPPRPHFGIINLEGIAQSALQRATLAGAQEQVR